MSFILYGFTAVGCLGLFLFFDKRRRGVPLPPAPPGLPFIGHLLRMPSVDSPLAFHEWARTYGDVMRLEVLGRTMIILDSYETAVDLLEKRGAIYSDRPRLTLYKALGWEPALTFMPYGKQFTKHRALHHSYLNPRKAEEFKVFQCEEGRTLARGLLQSSPDQYERFATGIITRIVSGHKIADMDDPYLAMSNMVFEAMCKTGVPGNSPLDFFPIRRSALKLEDGDAINLPEVRHFPPWFPGASHVGVVREWKPVIRELYEYSVRIVKKQRELGQVVPSFLQEQLESKDQSETADDDVKGAAATMFGAGEVTTWSAVAIFVLAMILHPEYQEKAQKEIDAVIGTQRLPDYGDRETLPVVEAILQETLRWRTGVPLGVPHRVMEDDVYRGMLIPKGAIVFANIRGMALDESVYSDPSSFYPERFLPKPAGRGEPYFNNTVFGFGRRICTGQHIAENSLWIAMVSILATCKITNAVDENSNIIIPDAELFEGLVNHPKDIRCVIAPRSPGAKALIMDDED
ncbi:cytochrome P450 [Mycena alexandri]|uniref:Cytochrome P450 n=1 Tax=Mycena alexandri TaxID=1745969 RepID=A0AAD6XBC2_9AGAR|nr:cytochrome P450 [Mycena alexandri]